MSEAELDMETPMETVEQVVQVSQPRKRNYTPEQREAMRERAKKALEVRKRNIEVRKELGLPKNAPMPSKYAKRTTYQKGQPYAEKSEKVITKDDDQESLKEEVKEKIRQKDPEHVRRLKQENKELRMRNLIRDEFESNLTRKRLEKQLAREEAAAEKNKPREDFEPDELVRPKQSFKFPDGTTIEFD
jgi:hypothetical protein